VLSLQWFIFTELIDNSLILIRPKPLRKRLCWQLMTRLIDPAIMSLQVVKIWCWKSSEYIRTKTINFLQTPWLRAENVPKIILATPQRARHCQNYFSFCPVLGKKFCQQCWEVAWNYLSPIANPKGNRPLALLGIYQYNYVKKLILKRIQGRFAATSGI
jgi:hypothetical protein